jgi:hypothetical protein
LLRHAQGHAERERRFTAADVAAEQNQIAAAEPSAEQFVERAEPGRDRVARDFAGTLCIHALDQIVEGGALFEATGRRWHDL